jgi:hypothetical protein
MLDAFLMSFGGGLFAWLILNGLTVLKVYQLSRSVKVLQEASLSDVRREAANKRWKSNQLDWTDPVILKELEKMNKNGSGSTMSNEPDKWSGILDR